MPRSFGKFWERSARRRPWPQGARGSLKRKRREDTWIEKSQPSPQAAGRHRRARQRGSFGRTEGTQICPVWGQRTGRPPFNEVGGRYGNDRKRRRGLTPAKDDHLEHARGSVVMLGTSGARGVCQLAPRMRSKAVAKMRPAMRSCHAIRAALARAVERLMGGIWTAEPRIGNELTRNVG
ncbi:hypothetical protein TRVL_09307 [Trypanosoma vivax]|nr:hypothetical protein TRVL_09307 [Trypanosoma vivax]